MNLKKRLADPNTLYLVPMLVLLALLIVFYGAIRHWLALHTGTDYCPTGLTPQQTMVCRAYGFWSGFGSDLGEYVLVGTFLGHLALLWRVHTCHGRWWCWRHPHFELDGTPYKLCAIHHPDDHPTVKQAIEQYQQAKDAA